MNLSELIAAVGDENVQLQNLDDCADSLDWSSKRGLKVTFGSEMLLTPDGTERLGLVIWLPRDVVAAVIAKSKPD